MPAVLLQILNLPRNDAKNFLNVKSKRSFDFHVAYPGIELNICSRTVFSCTNGSRTARD